jgi:Ca2+-binding EF-hand superfamily protein
VNVMEIFRVIKEKPNSVIAPYLTRYISLLEREEGERLKFVEFVRSISKYCLLNPPQILQFVFQCIDENQDGFVNKQEIMRFLRTEHDGKLIFPNNYMRAVELFETQRADKIDWIEFLRLVREVPYLSFPAFRLQQALRLYTLGEFTWRKINKRLINRKSMQELREKEQEAHRQSVQEKIWKLQQYTAENKLTLTSQRSYAAKPRGIVRKHSL